MEYLRLCLWGAAGIKSNPDNAKHLNQLNRYIRQNYATNDDNEMQKYVEFVKQILRAKRGLIELSCLFDLLNAELEILTQQCSDLLDSFGVALKDVSEPTRVLVAKILGILWAACAENVFKEQVCFEPTHKQTQPIIKYVFFFNLQIRNVLQSLINRSLEHRHGSLLAISHAYYRKIKRCHTNENNCPDFKKTVLILCGYLGDQQSLLVSAACKGLALIGTVASLPLPNGKDPSENAKSGLTSAQSVAADDSDQMQVDSDEEKVTKIHLMNTVLSLLKSAHSRPKIREEAAVCLGHLSIGDGEFFTHRNLLAYTGLLKLVSACSPAARIMAIGLYFYYVLLFIYLADT